MPRRFELYKEEGAEKIFGRIFTYFLVLMFWACLTVSLITREILELISDPLYWSASAIVPIIALATTVFTFHYHFNIGILIEKKTKYLAYINSSNAVIVIALNFLLIPTYGVFGAAIATLIAFCYKAVATYWLSSKYYSIHFEFKRIAHLLITSVALYVIGNIITSDHIGFRVVVKCILIFLYPAILLLTGFFNYNERARMKSKAVRISDILTRRWAS